jgi:uncharacterized protein (DUF302 family)
MAANPFNPSRFCGKVILGLLISVAAGGPVYAQTGESKSFKANTMRESPSAKERARILNSKQGVSQLPLRELFNVLAYKTRARDGLSFDDVLASMKLRANKINLKLVGANPLWKEVTATTGQPTPRVEIFSFCDALLARELLDYSLESVVFMPCRIAVLEDADKNIWLVTLNWDIDWLDSKTRTDPMPEHLRRGIQHLLNGVHEIIRAGAAGDF